MAVAVIDFGGQYSQLIARRIRECQVYCEVFPHTVDYDDIINDFDAAILSGGPDSIYEDGALELPLNFRCFKIPVLGICYGMQLLAKRLGGGVERGEKSEYGQTSIKRTQSSVLLSGFGWNESVWSSHKDNVIKLPENVRVLASASDDSVAVFQTKNVCGVQFHPEVSHTLHGKILFQNFLFGICNMKRGWTPDAIVESAVQRIRYQVGNKNVLCALSGGVDSAVVAELAHKAVGRQVKCLFVDNGLLRHNEIEHITKNFPHLNIEIIDRSVVSCLCNIINPEEKRRVIGKHFIDVFTKWAGIHHTPLLMQGTIYSDIIESGGGHGTKTIKSHHNVGGLPEDHGFVIIEPLKDLFKDEVRKVGLELGIPENIINRQPFPGPGLAIRIIGEVTEEKLEILRACDVVVQQEIEKCGFDKELWQYFAVLLDSRSVGVRGDERAYGYTVAVRLVHSEDAMTASWFFPPKELLQAISSRITQEVVDVNRVLLDITSKPPATIEYE